MKNKYHTNQDIEAFAKRNNAACTFGSVMLRVYKYWTAKGSYEVKFHRVGGTTLWTKKVVKG